MDAERHQRELSDAVLKCDSVTYKSRQTIKAITEWLVCMLSRVANLELHVLEELSHIYIIFMRFTIC